MKNYIRDNFYSILAKSIGVLCLINIFTSLDLTLFDILSKIWADLIFFWVYFGIFFITGALCYLFRRRVK